MLERGRAHRASRQVFKFHDSRHYGGGEIHSRFYPDLKYWSDFHPDGQGEGYLAWKVSTRTL